MLKGVYLGSLSFPLVRVINRVLIPTSNSLKSATVYFPAANKWMISEKGKVVYFPAANKWMKKWKRHRKFQLQLEKSNLKVRNHPTNENTCYIAGDSLIILSKCENKAKFDQV